MEEPGGGAVCRDLRLVRSYPSSAATPNQGSAQRERGSSTPLPCRARPGGGRGRRALGSSQALRMPGRGEGRARERRACTPAPAAGSVRLATRQWPRCARARLGARGVPVRAPGVCGTRVQSIPEVTGGGAGQAPAAAGFWFWHPLLLRGHLGEVLPRGQKCGRARVAVWAGVSFVSLALPRRWAARVQQSLYQGPRTSSSGFRVLMSGRPLVQIAYRPPSGSAGSRDALFGGSNGTFEGPLFGVRPLASQLGAFSFQPGEGKDLGTAVVLG